MKYILFVVFTFYLPDGDIGHNKFGIEYPSRDRCLAAQAEAERDLTTRYPNALALTTECRPKTPWDEPYSWNALPEFRDDGRLASN